MSAREAAEGRLPSSEVSCACGGRDVLGSRGGRGSVVQSMVGRESAEESGMVWKVKRG